MVVAEQYPELRATENFQKLQNSLSRDRGPDPDHAPRLQRHGPDLQHVHPDLPRLGHRRRLQLRAAPVLRRAEGGRGDARGELRQGRGRAARGRGRGRRGEEVRLAAPAGRWPLVAAAASRRCRRPALGRQRRRRSTPTSPCGSAPRRGPARLRAAHLRLRGQLPRVVPRHPADPNEEITERHASARSGPGLPARAAAPFRAAPTRPAGSASPRTRPGTGSGSSGTTTPPTRRAPSRSPTGWWPRTT